MTEAAVRFATVARKRAAAGMSRVNARGRDPRFTDPRGSIGIRTVEYKYVWYSNGESELYHLTRDPNELTNVVERKRYADVVTLDAASLDQVQELRGAQCRVALPKRWQVGPRKLARTTRTQSALVRRWLGH